MFYEVCALVHLTSPVHARREYGGYDLGADIVQRLGQDAHRVPWGGGIGVLEATVLVAGDGQDDALAGKDGFAVALVPAIKEPLDPKDTIRSS